MLVTSHQIDQVTWGWEIFWVDSAWIFFGGVVPGYSCVAATQPSISCLTRSCPPWCGWWTRRYWWRLDLDNGLLTMDRWLPLKTIVIPSCPLDVFSNHWPFLNPKVLPSFRSYGNVGQRAEKNEEILVPSTHFLQHPEPKIHSHMTDLQHTTHSIFPITIGWHKYITRQNFPPPPQPSPSPPPSLRLLPNSCTLKVENN